MDRNRFENIVLDNQKSVYNYILKILRNPEDAEDIIQEVFLAFYERMDNVKSSSCLSYIYRTAYNKSLNLLKRRSRRRTVSLNLNNPEHIPLLSVQDPVFDRKPQLIHKAFLKLKPEEAMLIEMQFYQKLSYKQIAERTSLTVSAVDSRLVRIKKKLKKIITQDSELPDVHINKEPK